MIQLGLNKLYCDDRRYEDFGNNTLVKRLLTDMCRFLEIKTDMFCVSEQYLIVYFLKCAIPAFILLKFVFWD